MAHASIEGGSRDRFELHGSLRATVATRKVRASALSRLCLAEGCDTNDRITELGKKLPRWHRKIVDNLQWKTW